MQAIPFEQRVRPSESRSLLRRSLRESLPAEIANRKGKTLNTDAAFKAVTREWPRLHKMLREAHMCAYGYINPEALLTALNRAREGPDPDSLSVIYLIALEEWLRGLEHRLSASKTGTRQEVQAKA
jgi:hypothetical protein